MPAGGERASGLKAGTQVPWPAAVTQDAVCATLTELYGRGHLRPGISNTACRAGLIPSGHMLRVLRGPRSTCSSAATTSAPTAVAGTSIARNMGQRETLWNTPALRAPQTRMGSPQVASTPTKRCANVKPRRGSRCQSQRNWRFAGGTSACPHSCAGRADDCAPNGAHCRALFDTREYPHSAHDRLAVPHAARILGDWVAAVAHSVEIIRRRPGLLPSE